MKTERIMVPKGKCPLEAIAELGERTRNAMILLHESAVEEMMWRAKMITESAGCCKNEQVECYWPKTDEYAETLIKCRLIEDSDLAVVLEIKADDIAFKKIVQKTDEILIFMME